MAQHTAGPSWLEWTSTFRFFALVFILGGMWLGCHEDEAEPTVKFVKPAMGDTVATSTVQVEIKTTQWSFAKNASHQHARNEASDASGALFKVAHGGEFSGHIHIFLDTISELDADAVLSMNRSLDSITEVKAGKHYLIAQGAYADHHPIAGMRDSVEFFVKVPQGK